MGLFCVGGGQTEREAWGGVAASKARSSAEDLGLYSVCMGVTGCLQTGGEIRSLVRLLMDYSAK